MLYRGLGVIFSMAYVKYFDRNVVYMFRRMVEKLPNKVVFVNATDGGEWTYQQVEDGSNKVANFFREQGYKKGDCVALYMTNRPEYIVTWY